VNSIKYIHSRTAGSTTPKGIIMKVLVIGTGNMGAGFVKQLTAAGHQVSVTARDTAKAQAVAQQFGAAAVPAAGTRQLQWTPTRARHALLS